MKRLLALLFGAALLAAAVVVLVQTLHEPGSGQQEVAVADRAAQVAHGAYLARAGNCMTCHTARDGSAYAGGRALATPFGTVYAPNLTPDPSTGLGRWSSNDFWRALHNGKSRDGSFLYPAFPYPNYTKVTRADSDALYAFFRTLAPVRQANRAHELQFPFNQRLLLAFWRTLYFTPGEYQVQPAQGALWNRGAYLVQGLGHCSACHAPRNLLGASLGEERLGGGTMPELGWHASALGGVRDTAQLAELLHSGVSETEAVYGPMAEVVGTSLQHLGRADIGAMAHYLATLPDETSARAPDARQPQGDPLAILRQGAGLYETHCASCHGAGGEGTARAYPRLAGQRGIASAATGNLVRMVLDGGYAPSTAGNPRPYGMPPFSGVLSDAEVAAVLSYVRASWGNQGALVLPQEVGRLRATPAP